MCARYTLTVPQRLRELFPRVRFPALVPRYNVAPSTPVLGLRGSAEDEAEFLTWGPRHINARAETLATKPTFAEAMRFRRAVVFADGYYEWRAEGGMRKQPYRLARANGAPFAFAAIWDEMPVAGDGPRYGTTLVTMAARDTIAWLHDRMPVLLDAAGSSAWLNTAALQPLDEALVVTPVSRAVNKAWRDDDPSLITPVVPPTQGSLF